MLICLRCGAPLEENDGRGFIEFEDRIYSEDQRQNYCANCGTPYSPLVSGKTYVCRGSSRSGIPPELLKDISSALRTTPLIVSNSAMRDIFVDSRISPWRNRVFETMNVYSRAMSVINTMFYQANAYDENALALFLEAVGDSLDDARFYALALAVSRVVAYNKSV